MRGKGLLALIIALSLVGAAPAEAAHFRAYTACGAKAKHAAAFCFEGDHPVAAFRAFDKARVPYKVCVRQSGEHQRCHDRRTRKPGQLSRTSFDIDGSGKYKLAFFTGGGGGGGDELVVRERAVFVVGDSLGEGTKPYLPGDLRGWKVSQSVATSRFLDEGVSIVRNRGSLPAVVVFALGTNNDPHQVSLFRDSVEAVLRTAG